MSDSADAHPRVIEPDPKTWTFAERERELFDSAKRIPGWLVANQASGLKHFRDHPPPKGA